MSNAIQQDTRNYQTPNQNHQQTITKNIKYLEIIFYIDYIFRISIVNL